MGRRMRGADGCTHAAGGARARRRTGDWFYQAVEVACFGMVIAGIVLVMQKFRASYEVVMDYFGNAVVPPQFGVAWLVAPAAVLALVRQLLDRPPAALISFCRAHGCVACARLSIQR